LKTPWSSCHKVTMSKGNCGVRYLIEFQCLSVLSLLDTVMSHWFFKSLSSLTRCSHGRAPGLKWDGGEIGLLKLESICFFPGIYSLSFDE
jgi:hypothetical protein